MQTMAVAWNNTTLNDKVKLPSVTEIGGGCGNIYYISEGFDYKIIATSFAIDPIYSWCRTYDKYSSGYVWIMNNSGVSSTVYFSSANKGSKPIIRLN